MTYTLDLATDIASERVRVALYPLIAELRKLSYRNRVRVVAAAFELKEARILLRDLQLELMAPAVSIGVLSFRRASGWSRATVYRLLPHIKRHVEIWAELDNELQGSRVFPYYKVIRRNGRVDVYAGSDWCFAGSYWR